MHIVNVIASVQMQGCQGEWLGVIHEEREVHSAGVQGST